ncbi:MAG: hypothetical protein WCA39_04125 [Nitrososphaeraceae archaeon]
MEKILSHSSKNTTSAVIDLAIHFQTKLGGFLRFGSWIRFSPQPDILYLPRHSLGNSNHEVKDEQLRISEFSHFYHACPAD